MSLAGINLEEAARQAKADLDAVHAAGYDKAVADFSKAQAFNSVSGARITDCRNKYSGYGWNDETFAMANSLYSIDGLAVTYATNMFLYANITNIDLFLDLSNATNIDYVVANAPVLKRIKRIKFPNLSSASVPFASCISLKEIEVEGEIVFTISFSACPLNKASILSVVNALSDTATGKTCTFKATAVNAAFTTDEWNALKATKNNWTFATK